ncbi:MAG TPA: glutaredoxin family protein [Methylotenera sp.]|nr:glutaredoxin family protein [Methylotenera sp.]
MTISLALYSTSHCHLCEQAENLLVLVIKNFNIELSVIEITDHPELLTRYEVKIPVLQRLDNFAEICWPFDTADIIRLLKS